MVRINFFFTVVSKDSVWVLRYFLGQWNYYFDFWLLSPFWQFSIRNLTFFITDSIGLFEPLNTHRGEKKPDYFHILKNWCLIERRKDRIRIILTGTAKLQFMFCWKNVLFYLHNYCKKYFLFFAWGRDCVKCYSSLCSREGVQYDPIRRSSSPPPPPPHNLLTKTLLLYLHSRIE